MPQTTKQKSKRATGKATENLARSLLEGAGYAVHATQGHKWHEIDIYGVFDMTASRRGAKLKFVQATDQKHMPDRRRKIEEQPVVIKRCKRGKRSKRSQSPACSHNSILDFLPPEHTEVEVWGDISSSIGESFVRDRWSWKECKWTRVPCDEPL